MTTEGAKPDRIAVSYKHRIVFFLENSVRNLAKSL